MADSIENHSSLAIAREAETSPAPSKRLPWRGWFTFGVCFLVVHLVYRGVGAEILRAENSLYLIDASQWERSVTRIKWAFSESYNGHYAPLVFCMELGFSALFGPRADWWALRQQFAVALVAFSLLRFFESVLPGGGKGERARRGTLPISIGLTALFTLTPTLLDLVAWPFMVLQLLWALATVWSLYWLGRAAAAVERADPAAPRHALWAALCGYGSLHCLGIGLATLGGIIVALETLALAAVWRRLPRAQCWRLFSVVNLTFVLGGLHAAAMLLLPTQKTPAAAAAHVSISGVHLLAQTLGFFSCFLVACVRAVWNPNAWPYAQSTFLAQEWPYALATLGFFAAAAGALGRAVYRRQTAGQPLRRLCWQLFSLISFVMLALLMAVRAVAEANPWGNFLFGARYLWPGSILLLGTLACLLADRRLRPGAWAQACGWMLALGAAAGNLVYQRQVIPTVLPFSAIFHQTVWNTAVEMAREFRAASLPLPNLSVDTHTEFAFPLRLYEPLLRRTLRLPESQPILWAEPSQIDASRWEDLRRLSPSLDRLQALMALPGTPPPPPLDPEPTPAPAELTPSRWDRSLLAEPLRSRVIVHDAKMPPNLGVDIPVGSITHHCLWNNPPTALEFRDIDLDHRSRLRCAAAIHPAVWKENTADGAVFQVGVRTGGGGPEEIVWRRRINPIAHLEQRAWMEIYVDLSKYEGQRIDLILTNLPGPAGNDYADWCLWGDPFLTAPDGRMP